MSAWFAEQDMSTAHKNNDWRHAARQVHEETMIASIQHLKMVICCSLVYKSRLALLQISMVDGALFDALEALARGIRSKQEPFGGIQLILAGRTQVTLSPLYI